MRNRTLLCGLLALMPLPASAHVTLAENQAQPGSHYVAHFRVGHGCNGSPTTALSIAIPDGVRDAEATPQSGWTVSSSQESGHIALGWKGGMLPGDKPGEFTASMTLPDKPVLLAFVATQTCQQGQEIWSEMPAADGHHLNNPVPLLYVGMTPPVGPVASTAPTALSLSDGWMRLLPGGLPVGGYFTLRNSGSGAVALTGADSPACGTLMLHKSEDKGGMSSMQDVTEVNVPAGGSVSFSPGGYHLMCMDPKPMLKQGAAVPVTLSFKGAPPLTAGFDVRGATGK